MWPVRDRTFILTAGVGLVGGTAAALLYGLSENEAVQLAGSMRIAKESSGSAHNKAPSLDDDYKLGRQLGNGNYGVVHAATHRRTGRQVAIKVIPRTHDRGDDAVRREVGVMQRVGLHRWHRHGAALQ